ncbi:Fatty-acid-binding protein 3, chloroplastic, partial [Linum perenne]
VATVGTAEYLEEPATNVKFPAYLTVPGRSSSLSLLGTGYREKTFAIIGVKVYAAGLYVDQSLFSALTSWKDQSSAEIEANSSLFGSILKAPSEKSLRIVLVRDVDGKTFWDALDGAISPRIKAPTEADKPALAKFRATFENGTLKKGAVIFLTWLDPCKMHVSFSQEFLCSCSLHFHMSLYKLCIPWFWQCGFPGLCGCDVI